MKTRPFYILLAGQSISILGSGMTSFAVMIWAYQIDERAATLALLGFFINITYVITHPYYALRAGAAARLLGPLVGSGPGSGMAAMVLFTAVGGVLTALLGLASPAIRGLDRAAADAQPAENVENFEALL